MALHRFTTPVDGTIPIQALLYQDEELLSSQDGVGIYDGLQKSAPHQAGTVHVTTHRIFFINSHPSRTNSFAFDLALVKQTEYYAGLFTSSSKVTLHLDLQLAQASIAASSGVFDSWRCEVCGHKNPPGLSPAAARICGLCGVPRVTVSTAKSPASAQLQTSTLHHSSSFPSSQASPRDTTTIACAACTFENHPSLTACEICGTVLPSHMNTTLSAPASRPTSPNPEAFSGSSSSLQAIKISFRKGGDKAFYAVLKLSLKSKAWEVKLPPPPVQSAGGISGIITSVTNNAESTMTQLNDAFKDLEALKSKAKDMVRIAADLNQRLTASPTSGAIASEPEEATFIRSSLSQLGLQLQNAPITQDMIRDEKKWLEEMAKELAQILLGSDGPGSSKKQVGLMHERGIIALDEAWGGWNRARGIALIPPSTFLQVLQILPSVTSPLISTRAFPSGLQVLHTPDYTHWMFSSRLAALLKMNGPRKLMEIAAEENVSVALAMELVNAVEQDGNICRDDASNSIIGEAGLSFNEVLYYENVFRDYQWDGQED